MTKQQVAIGSKGQSSVAVGVKAKGGSDKVSALRKQFDSYGSRFASCEFSIEEQQATKLGIVLEATEATNNNETAIAAMRESFKVALLAAGNQESTARSRTTEAMRIQHAYYLTVSSKTDKEGKVTFAKLKEGEKGNTGKALLLKAPGFAKAAALATKIKLAAGIKTFRAPPAKVGKAWTKGDCIDALETLCKHARALPDFDQSVMVKLGEAWAAMKGKARAKVERTLVSADRVIPAILTNKNGKAVTKGSAQWQAMSRGQKAAATRRYHAHLNGQRQVSNQTIQ